MRIGALKGQDVARVTGQALDSALTRSKLQSDFERFRPLNSFAWARAQRIESGQRFAHGPAAALGQGEQVLSHVRQVLLDCEASNGAPLELRVGCIATEKLSLDMDREI